MDAQVLLLTGAVGVGKSTVAYEVRLRLLREDVGHVLIDDEFALLHPPAPGDPRAEGIRGRALAALWAVYADAGIDRLVLSRVIESDRDLDQVRAALPDAAIRVFWLVAPLETIAERIRSKGVPTARDWCLGRSAGLLQTWDAHPLNAEIVDTDGREVTDIADEIVTRSGWTRSR